MFYILTEEERKKVQEVSDITLTDYEVMGKTIPVANLMSAVEDLLVELHKKEEDISYLKNDIENNYVLKEEEYYE
jgi:hypothetical protein